LIVVEFLFFSTNMKKQHIILIPVIIMLYVIYLIISYKYDEYKIDRHIDSIVSLNESLRSKIETTKELIEYKSSKAYINKVLKQEKNQKNKAEIVLLITPQKEFEKYTSDIPEINSDIQVIPKQINITDNMSIKQRWMYFLFKNDTR